MARKVQDLEELVKAQADQMLSKVGPLWGHGQGPV